MKLEKFESIIRKVVREEIDMAMGKVIKEIKSNNSPLIEERSHVNGKGEAPIVNSPVTGNKSIDQLLRETAASFGNPSVLGENEIPSTFSTNDPTQAFIKDYSAVMDKIENKENFRP